MKISNRLYLNKVEHEELGSIFELESPNSEDGSSAFTLVTSTIEKKYKSGKTKQIEESTGVKLRLTKETALKLALKILASVSKENA